MKKKVYCTYSFTLVNKKKIVRSLSLALSLSLMCNRNKTKYDGRCTAHVFHLNVPITNSYLHGCAFNDLTL